MSSYRFPRSSFLGHHFLGLGDLGPRGIAGSLPTADPSRGNSLQELTNTDPILEDETCPKLVVTAKTGKEDRAVRELEDLLYKLDPHVIVKRTRYRDFIEIFSSIDANSIFEEIRRKPPYSSIRAVKIDFCIEAEISKIANACIDILKHMAEHETHRVKIECSKRGSYIKSCKAVEIAVGIAIERSGVAIVDLKKPTSVIKIEIIDNKAYIGIMKPGSDKLHKKIS
jgi:tRNA(Ser,Leu) C12 N-acetylase TAN1